MLDLKNTKPEWRKLQKLCQNTQFYIILVYLSVIVQKSLCSFSARRWPAYNRFYESTCFRWLCWVKEKMSSWCCFQLKWFFINEGIKPWCKKNAQSSDNFQFAATTRALLFSDIITLQKWFLPRCTLIPPQEWLERKSTGDVTPGWTGYLRRKSSSAGFISLFISRIWGHNKQVGLWDAVFSAETRFTFHLIRLKQGCGSQEMLTQWQAGSQNKPCRRSLSYLEGELSDVRELVTLKQASGGVLEDRGGDAVN